VTGARAAHGALAGLTVLVYIFLLAPVGVVIALAFNASPLSVFPITRVTLHWFAALASDPAIIRALKTSLILGVTASLISTTIGTAAAYALARFRFAGRDAAQLLLTVPILVPHIILGIGLLLSFHLVGLIKSFPLLMVGHVAITLPYVVLTTRHRLEAIPQSLEEAAQTLGANRWQSFMAVTVPLALPAIVTALLFAFMISFDEITATLFWRPPNLETVPTQIMAMLEYSVDQKINSLATVLIAATVGLPVFALLFVQARSAVARSTTVRQARA
jgi:spermidine/putrescine transport system permease protein